MATIKSYTDIEQSKKLAEILPPESADMCFVNDGTSIKIDANSYNTRKLMWKDVQLIPCWSLAALMNLLPSEFTTENEFGKYKYEIKIRKYKFTDEVNLYQIAYGNYKWHEDGSNSWKDMINTGEKEDLLDAAFEMVCWLKENKKI